MSPQQIKDLQTQLNLQGANLKVDGVLGPLTIAAMNNAISGAVASNPNLSYLVSQNSPEAIADAYQTGNWSGIVDTTGKPFSDEMQREAVTKAEEALAPGFRAGERYAEDEVVRSLEDTNRNFNDYLDKSAEDFQTDKENLDQDAANKGVLFSGARIQKEKNLKNLYEKDLASKTADYRSNIGKIASDYQYRYGDAAANNPRLSSYYSVGGNTYNPKVARGGAVRSPSLSTVFSTGNRGYQGTEKVSNKAAVQTRAASLLANRANKLVPYGYKTQF